MKQTKVITIQTELISADELDQDKRIDILNLGMEVLMIPTLLEKYSRYSADLCWERDLLKTKLAHKRAILGMEMRADPEEYFLTKVTDKSIEEALDADEGLYNLAVDLHTLNSLAQEAIGAHRAIQEKGNALRYSVELYKTGYYGEMSAIPEKMQTEINLILGKNELQTSLDENPRLMKMKKEKEDGEKK